MVGKHANKRWHTATVPPGIKVMPSHMVKLECLATRCHLEPAANISQQIRRHCPIGEIA